MGTHNMTYAEYKILLRRVKSEIIDQNNQGNWLRVASLKEKYRQLKKKYYDYLKTNI